MLRIYKDNDDFCVDYHIDSQVIKKTFNLFEDAELFIFYRERLEKNMKSFDVPIQERITLQYIIDMKINASKDLSVKTLNDLKNAAERLNDIFGKDRLYSEISIQEWEEAVRKIYRTETYRGSDNEKNKILMSPITLRRIIANASSAISYAQDNGINIENNAQLVINSYIKPLIARSR